jgi:hypothetical protein
MPERVRVPLRALIPAEVSPAATAGQPEQSLGRGTSPRCRGRGWRYGAEPTPRHVRQRGFAFRAARHRLCLGRRQAAPECGQARGALRAGRRGLLGGDEHDASAGHATAFLGHWIPAILAGMTPAQAAARVVPAWNAGTQVPWMALPPPRKLQPHPDHLGQTRHPRGTSH